MHVSSNFNRIVETEKLLKVTGSHVDSKFQTLLITLLRRCHVPHLGVLGCYPAVTHNINVFDIVILL